MTSSNMEKEEYIRQRQVANVSLHTWGVERRAMGVLMFFSQEYLFQNDTTITHFLYKMVDSVLRVNDRELLVQLKNFNVQQFTMSTKQEASNVMETLIALAAYDDPRDFYAFHYRPTFTLTDTNNPFAEAEGWDMFDFSAQLARMRVPAKEWRITTINADYQFCPTYPSRFAVPSGLDDFFLEAVAQYRHRRRVPTLAYYFSPTKACILRSGQPLIGAKRTRCFEDEKLMGAVSRSSGKESPVSIFDMRTKANATTAFARGGGYEPTERYGNCKISFARLEHPYILKEFLLKLLEVCRQADVSTSQFLQDTGPWLSQVQVCLSAAVALTKAVAINGTSVLLHCDDDSDTVPIICSLAKIMIDPYYRTYKGFQMLIEEDWLAFGFRFSDRCGHLKSDSDVGRRENQIPYLALFVDCIFQILEQFPTSCEFNELLLHRFFEHTHSCQFGTFLMNSERERMASGVAKQTVSFWSYLNSQAIKPTMLNKFYRPNNGILKVAADSRSITFKSGFYNPWQHSHIKTMVKNEGADPLHEYLLQQWQILSAEVDKVLVEKASS